MALTDGEHKSLVKLWASCMDKDGKPRADATTKELKDLGELIRKTKPDEPIRPQTVKNYRPSEHAKGLLEDGAEFQGFEVRNFGTQEKPDPVLREWFYIGKGKDRKAAFVQKGRVIEAGRTIARSAYTRFQK